MNNPLFTLAPRQTPWKVPTQINSRGYEYYSLHRIQTISFRNNTVFATVRGSNRKIYSVEISKASDSALVCHCTCPFFADNGVCKHIIATWYEWTDERSKYIDHADDDDLPAVKPKAETSDTGIPQHTMIQLNHLIQRSSHFDNTANIFFPHSAVVLLEGLELMSSVQIKSVDFYTLTAAVGNEQVKLSFMSSNPDGKCSACCTSHRMPKCPHHMAVEFFLYTLKHPENTPEEHQAVLTERIHARTYQVFKKGFDAAFETDSEDIEIIFSFIPNSDGCALKIQKAKRLKNGRLGVLSDYKTSLATPPNDYNEDVCQILKKCLSITQIPGAQRIFSASCVPVLDALNDHDASIIENLRRYQQIRPEHVKNAVFVPKPLQVLFEMKQQHDTVIFELVVMNESERILLKDMLIFGGRKYLYAMKAEDEMYTFYRLDSHMLTYEQLSELKKWCGAPFHSQYYQEFIESLLHKLPDDINITLPAGGQITDISDVSPVACIYLKELYDTFEIELKFRYDTETISYKATRDILRKSGASIERISRCKEKESELLAEFYAHNVYKSGDEFYPSADPVVWLLEDARSLAAKGFEIFGQDSLFKYRLNKNKPRVNVRIQSGLDWFDISGTVSAGDDTVDFKKFIEALTLNQRYIRIDNGSIIEVPREWREKLSGITGFIDQSEENLAASKAQIGIIEALADMAEEMTYDKAYADLRQKFRSFEKIHEVEPPAYFKGILRDYQKSGFCWLNFLKEFGIGGCLADEMGLGKTVQVLAQILHCKNTDGSKPSLIIVPTSLIFNWCQEIQKFTPTLTFYVHHGTAREREIAVDHDIILTSYGIVRRDIETLEKIRFRYAVADESQSIKNPLSESAKAIRRLKADNRLCMTGTPVENTSVDLWSQFSFCNPGLLGSLDFFKKTYAKRIETADDIKMAESLRRLSSPFILARKKSVVASELPEKQITSLHCEMTPEQRIFYDAWKEKIRNDITDTISQKGFSKSRIEILQGLLRLRQICNHPRLVSPDYTGGSGKLDILFRHFDTVIEEGHKILVFSTFLGMLDLIRKRFNQQNIRYSYLDGSTKDRQEAVNVFKENHAVKAFLISIKAGGFGLNLEEADYVYIVDPWWNPAVEMQAIDRAHRIGQTQNVFVYKSVCTNSIEEKILELQEKKLAIAENIISFEKDIFKTLTAENLQQLFD